ncbi:MAG: DUF2283 domain-containing protein [Candidatus Bathyarchaeia archaeon]
MASLEYDPSSTALYVRMKRGKVVTSTPLADNIILDLNKKNELLGIEIIGPRPEDLNEFKPKAKNLARA